MDAPAVAVGPAARKVAIAWMDMRRGGGERDVVLQTMSDGKIQPQESLGTQNDGAQGHPALVFDGAGHLHAVWESAGKIVALVPGEKQEEIVLSDANEVTSQPALAASGDLVVVAYEAQRGGKKVAVVRRR